MSRNNIMRIGAVLVSLFVLAGVPLWLWSDSTAGDPSVVEVVLEKGETEIVQFENLGLIPGEQCEYEISFGKSRATEYDLSFDFVEKKEGTLKQYACARIESKDETIYDGLLAELFEKELSLTVDFTKELNTDLKIIYYLPIDVGNEAQNAEALFELRLTASNE